MIFSRFSTYTHKFIVSSVNLHGSKKNNHHLKNTQRDVPEAEVFVLS